MDVLGHKLVALFLILVVIFTSAAMPIKLSEWFERLGGAGKRIISAVMCFGGGFFLGTLLLHTMPEVEELVMEAINKPYDISFPLAYFFTGCGFFMMLFMEKGVTDLVTWNDKRKAKEKPDVASGRGPLGEVGDNRGFTLEEGGKPTAEAACRDIVELTAYHGLEQRMHVEHNHKDPMDQSEGKSRDSIGSEKHVDIGHGHSHSDGEGGHSHVHGSAARSVVLLLALSIDCVFEGLSLGLQRTSSGVWRMVMAILSHEIVVAFSLGLQLLKHNTKKKTLLMALVYGLTTPAGISVGLAINETFVDNPGFDITFGVLLGLTGGVFLYVTFFEILMHEFVHEMRMLNIMAVLLGFSIMAIIMGSGAHQHEHDLSNRTNAATMDSFMYRHFGII